MMNGYPSTLEEALALRSQGMRPIGGGTDLMVRYRNRGGLLPRFAEPLLFLRNVEDLNILKKEKGILRIGASLTLRELIESPLTPQPLQDILLQVASFAVRSQATLAGNIGNASPAADSLPFLYCRDSQVLLAGQKGERTLPLADFILGPGKTALQDDEIIKEILLPTEECDFFFHKKVGGRRSSTIAKLSFYGEIYQGDEGIEDLRLAFGSVAAQVVRLRQGEKIILKALRAGQEPEAVWPLYEKAIRPIDDQRSTAQYRKQVSFNLLKRFIQKTRKKLA